MNYLYNSIIFCSFFLSIQWFVLVLYKFICVKSKKKYETSGHLVKFKFTYVSLMLVFIIFIFLAICKWHKYQLLFSVVEGVLNLIITFGITVFLYFNHVLTTEPSNFKFDKNIYSVVRKVSAIVVSVCLLLLDIFPYLI